MPEQPHYMRAIDLLHKFSTVTSKTSTKDCLFEIQCIFLNEKPQEYKYGDTCERVTCMQIMKMMTGPRLLKVRILGSRILDIFGEDFAYFWLRPKMIQESQ
jgi:hypothetical protein